MSIIVVGVTKKDEYNSLKCRSVPISLINKAFMEATTNDDKYERVTEGSAALRFTFPSSSSV